MSCRQERLGALGGPQRSWRIVARGFCIAPASTLNSDARILVSRFDFAGQAVFEDPEAMADGKCFLDDSGCAGRGRRASASAAPEPQEGAPLELATFPRTSLEITHRDEHRPLRTATPFEVWIADTPERATQGLMFVSDLPETLGMVFPLNRRASRRCG